MRIKKHNKPLRRVALFSGNYNCVVDGANRALNQLVAYLERRGVEVQIYAPTCKNPAFRPAGRLISVPSIPIPSRGEYRLAGPLSSKIKKHIRAFSPDLIHLSAPDLLGYSALKWAKSEELPVVASFHTRFDTYPRYYNMAWMEKHLVRYMKHFYGLCDQVYSPSACITDFLGSLEIKDTVRPWGRGIDTDLFNPQKRDLAWRQSMGIADDEIVLLFVGRLVLEKGLGVYADIIDQLGETDTKAKFKALIVGEGPEGEHLRKRLPAAIFTGFLTGQNLARAYASADIFINPSITETFGNVTLEAMTSGVPVVCADASGARALVKNGEQGLMVQPTDINDYVQSILELAEDPKLRQKMSKTGHQSGLGLSWDSVLCGLYDHYLEALAAHQYINSRSWATSHSKSQHNTLNHTNS